MEILDIVIEKLTKFIREKQDYDEREAKKLQKEHKSLFGPYEEKAKERAKEVERGDSLATDLKLPSFMFDDEGKLLEKYSAFVLFALQSFGYDKHSGMIRKTWLDSLKTAVGEFELKSLEAKKFYKKTRQSISTFQSKWKAYQEEYKE